MPSMERREEILLMVDIIMFIIAIVSIILMALNFYRSGFFFGGGNAGYAQTYLMYGGASIATLSVSMTWIFVRFFRNWSKRTI